jgi:molybdopterin molybdotransferase
MISFDEAYRRTLEQIQVLGEEVVPLLAAIDRYSKQSFSSKVDSPTNDASLKDGFAIHSRDVNLASEDNQIELDLIGSVTAGGDWQGVVRNGEAVQILSGARIPQGADSVLAEEFTRKTENKIIAFSQAKKGRNILKAGTDVQKGQALISKGEWLTPMKIGLLASAGYVDLSVNRIPYVAIIATGDEVVAPGNPLPEGKLYASNLITLAGWCLHFGFGVKTFVVPDDRERIRKAITEAQKDFDIILTSGGAWKSDRDLVAKILNELGWRKVYHRIKMGPGKAVGFGLLEGKPIFLLPGGPPSNHMAFIQLVVPALHKMAGFEGTRFPIIEAKISKELSGQSNWTQFIHGNLCEEGEGNILFEPTKEKSRLQMLASTNSVAKIPEGIELIPKGASISVQKLTN